MQQTATMHAVAAAKADGRCNNASAHAPSKVRREEVAAIRNAAVADATLVQ